MFRPRYRIESCIGRGGFGEVFSAVGKEGRVALKVLRADLDPSTQAVERLQDEAKWMRLLDHPALPRVHALGRVEGRVALVTELVPGDDLSRLVRGDHPPSQAAAVEIAARVADALDAAWSRQVRGHPEPLRLVHRDVKPANIRIRPDGTVALLDFGIARTDTHTRDAHTRSSGVIGSPGFMAPERFLGDPPHASDDIFGLGCVLFETLTGRRLLGGLSFPAYAGLAADPSRLASHIDRAIDSLPRDLPPALPALLRGMVDPHPDRRPSAARVYATCLEVVPQCSGPSLRAWATSRSWDDPPAKPSAWAGRTISFTPLVSPQRRPLGTWGAGAIVAIGAALLIGWIASTPPTPDRPIPSATRELAVSADPPTPVEIEPVVLDVEFPIPSRSPKGSPTSAPVKVPVPARPASPNPALPGEQAEPPPNVLSSATTPASSPKADSRPMVDLTLDEQSDLSEVVLVSASESWTVPGQVPPGTYRAEGHVHGRIRALGTLDVPLQASMMLRCAFGRCIPSPVSPSDP